MVGAIDHVTSAIDPCSHQRIMKDDRLARRNELVLISMEDHERRITCSDVRRIPRIGVLRITCSDVRRVTRIGVLRIPRSDVRRITRIGERRITATDVAQGIGDRMRRGVFN